MPSSAPWRGVAESREVRPKGRPKKDAVFPVKTEYHVRITIGDPDRQVLKDLLDREATFLLITNIPESEASDREILEWYKEQTSVELNFRFLKHPLLVDGIYV